jgi:hypothetical protein
MFRRDLRMTSPPRCVLREAQQLDGRLRSSERRHTASGSWACKQNVSTRAVAQLTSDKFHYEQSSFLHQLRCVSKRLNDFAESVLYKVVVLGEDYDTEERASYRIIERILDSSDPVRFHVRKLSVSSFKGDENSSCMNARLLVDCIRSIHKLASFGYVSLESIRSEDSALASF